MNEPLYVVVKNHEDQYSIWDADVNVPAGWIVIGSAQAKQDCLAFVEVNWVDMRPASLVRHMAS